MEKAIKELQDTIKHHKSDLLRSYVSLNNELIRETEGDNYNRIEELNIELELLRRMITDNALRKAGYYIDLNSNTWIKDQGDLNELI